MLATSDGQDRKRGRLTGAEISGLVLAIVGFGWLGLDLVAGRPPFNENPDSRSALRRAALDGVPPVESSSSSEAPTELRALIPVEAGTIPSDELLPEDTPGPVSTGPIMRDPVLFDEHYAPTKERWMSRGASLLGALETTPEELAELPASFWAAHPEWTYLRDNPKGWETLFDVLPVAVEIELELQWQDEANRFLFGEHQKLYREQDLLVMALDESLSSEAKRAAEIQLEVVRDRLEALRRALWSASPPAYFFLYELAKAQR